MILSLRLYHVDSQYISKQNTSSSHCEEEVFAGSQAGELLLHIHRRRALQRPSGCLVKESIAFANIFGDIYLVNHTD